MPALRVLHDVLVFRLRRREMANLAGAASVAVVLGLGGAEIGARLGFALLLNLLVYLNNDCHDLGLDLRDPGRERARVAYLRAHLGAAIGAQICLVVALVGLALAIDLGLLVPLVVGGGVCWAYSARLKRIAGLDVSAMIVWGAAMSMCGAPLERAVGLAMAAALGLFSGVFEVVQVLRDRDADRACGLRTTAVVLGERGALWLARGLMLAAAAFLALLIDPFAGGLACVAVILPC